MPRRCPAHGAHVPRCWIFWNVPTAVAVSASFCDGMLAHAMREGPHRRFCRTGLQRRPYLEGCDCLQPMLPVQLQARVANQHHVQVPSLDDALAKYATCNVALALGVVLAALMAKRRAHLAQARQATQPEVDAARRVSSHDGGAHQHPTHQPRYVVSNWVME